MSSPELVEEAADGAKALAPKSKKKLIVLGAAAGVLLLGGGGAAMMFTGAKAEAASDSQGWEGQGDAGNGNGKANGDHGGASEAGGSFVDVPAMVVNLRSPDGASRFLKIHFMIVPGASGTPETLKARLPLILDAYQPFLRELRPEDLAGSAAVFRIKEEMLVRATGVAGPGMVKDILIQDLVQQ